MAAGPGRKGRAEPRRARADGDQRRGEGQRQGRRRARAPERGGVQERGAEGRDEAAPEETEERIVIGEIIGVHGVRGWIKARSRARPEENIFRYNPWSLAVGGGTRRVRHRRGRRQGKGLIAQLDGVTERAAAEALVGAEIGIARAQLPPLPPGSHYWHELLRLEVVNLAGRTLGRVAGLEETGANDVLVVEGERRRLIPWVRDVYIRRVDVAGGRIVVDWAAEG